MMMAAVSPARASTIAEESSSCPCTRLFPYQIS